MIDHREQQSGRIASRIPVPTIGSRLGRLTVISEPTKIGKYRKVLCRCDCGREKHIRLDHFQAGLSTSCGCYARLTLAACAESRVEHGDSRRSGRASEWQVWARMLQRCNDPNSPTWSRYGGRGIKVCERWAASYAAFLKDMGRRPDPKLTIDRINNNGNYEPSNCRWATRIEQANNRRTNRRLTYNGMAMTVAEWGRQTGILGSNIQARIARGWSVERTLSEPIA